MKKIFNTKTILIGIFLLTLAFRLYFAFQTNNFSSDDAYFHLRHANYIKENIAPMFYDELSYGGRYSLYPPLFHYFVLLIMYIPFALKIIPEVLLASLVFIIFLLSKRITNDDNSSLFAASISAFVPLFIGYTVNQLSIYSVVLPITFYMFYCFMRLEEEKYLNRFIFLSFVLPLLHPTAFLFMLAMLLYVMLASAEDIKLSKIKREAIIFSSFLILFIGFIIYKRAFLTYGLDIIFGNIPFSLFSEYFRDISLLEIFYYTGIIPLFFGGAAMFYNVFREKNDNVFLLGSFMLIDLLLLVTGLIDINVGLMLIGLTTSVLSAVAVSKFFKYIKLTKFSKFTWSFFILRAILIVLLLIFPSFVAAKTVVSSTPTDDDINALGFLRDNLEDVTILGNAYEGNMINAIAGKKNVMDNFYLLAPNPEQRLNDINVIYNTGSNAIASELLQYNKIGYVFLSTKTKRLYNITDLKYKNEICFKEFGKGYKVLC
ncbi:MAG: hypothetical protein AB1571_03690 [Nanoarchaeota archaeon]